MKKLLVFLCAIIFVFGLFNMANATVLTFDIHGIADNKDIPKSYGDRVTSATMPGDPAYINYANIFYYGTDGGFTPNVTVNYQPDYDSTKPLKWDGEYYSDLYGVVRNFVEPNGDTGFKLIFTADTDYLVSLSSFDIGKYVTPSDNFLIVPSISIWDNLNMIGAPLWSQTNITVFGYPNSHLNFNLSDVISETLVLYVNTAGLGYPGKNIGIDNLTFSQSVAPIPEPATMLLLGTGLIGLAVFRKRTKK